MSRCQQPSEPMIVSLSKMKPGQNGIINTLDMKNKEQVQKLTSLGVFPGFMALVIQTWPSFVFQIGYSQYAVDKELADCILVLSV